MSKENIFNKHTSHTPPLMFVNVILKKTQRNLPYLHLNRDDK